MKKLKKLTKLTKLTKLAVLAVLAVLATAAPSGRRASVPLPASLRAEVGCSLTRPGAHARATGGATKGMGIGGMQRKERAR